jgi:hypothetical protein
MRWSTKRYNTERLSKDEKAIASLKTQRGMLTDTEMEALVVIYAAGAKEDMLIGLRQHVRLLYLLLPGQPSETLTARQTERSARKLRALGCDGYIHVRRARLHSSIQTDGIMMIQGQIGGKLLLKAVKLVLPVQCLKLIRDSGQDAIYHALWQAFHG